MVKKLKINEDRKSNIAKTKARTDIYRCADEIISTVEEINKLLDSYNKKTKNILDNTDAYITFSNGEFDEYKYESNMEALRDNLRILDEFKRNMKQLG